MPNSKTFFFLILIIFINSCNSSSQNTKSETIVFKDSEGHKILKSDLQGSNGTYNWEIMSNKKNQKRRKSYTQKQDNMVQRVSML